MSRSKEQVRINVGYILEHYPFTRNSDSDLCWMYWREFDGLGTEGVSNMGVYADLTNHDTISRNRRRWNAHPRMMYLASDPMVLTARRQAKGDYAEYYASISNMSV